MDSQSKFSGFKNWLRNRLQNGQLFGLKKLKIILKSTSVSQPSSVTEMFLLKFLAFLNQKVVHSQSIS